MPIPGKCGRVPDPGGHPPSGPRRRACRGGLPLLAALALVAPAGAQQAPVSVVERETLAGSGLLPPTAATAPDHRLDLALVHFAEGPWPRAEVLRLATGAVALLVPCGIWLGRVERLLVEAPEPFHYLRTPVSRELARALRPPRPTLYFVTDTRQQPAFDAEAIGRGNSRTRPELQDSVWLTRPARDPAIALAHELVHVLVDSGAHVDTPGNLMRDQTAPGSTALDPAQCAALRAIGRRNGLLRAEAP